MGRNGKLIEIDPTKMGRIVKTIYDKAAEFLVLFQFLTTDKGIFAPLLRIQQPGEGPISELARSCESSRARHLFQLQRLFLSVAFSDSSLTMHDFLSSH